MAPVFFVQEAKKGRHRVPANTKHWANVGLMLDHRLRRWANIKPLWLNASYLLSLHQEAKKYTTELPSSDGAEIAMGGGLLSLKFGLEWIIV